jgi:hypothetical protein
MSDRENAQKVYQDRLKASNPSAFDTIGAFNKYHNTDKNPSSLALPLDMGRSVPPANRADAIAAYNAQNKPAPKQPDQPGFWGKTFAAMETGYNFATQAVSFGLTLPEKTNPIWNSGFNLDGVKKAWDESHEISAGRSIMNATVGNAINTFSNAFSGIAKTVSFGKLSGTDKFLQDHILFAANDFDIFNKKQREEAFREQMVGRIGSFSTDVVARFVIDPTIFAGKALKAYKGISTVVKGTEELKAIMAGEKTGFKAEKVKATFTSFIENTDDMTPSDLFRVKAIRESSNPATFADLLGQANKITDKAVRHQTKADLIYMAMGDAAAAERLLQTDRLLAAKVAAHMDEVAEAKYMGAGLDKATNQFTFDLVNKGTDLEKTQELITQYSDELTQVRKQLDAESILNPNLVPKLDAVSAQRQLMSNSQKFIDIRGGIASVPVRVMTGFFYKRPKGWIDFTDNQSVQTIDNMLSRVRGVSEKQAEKYQGKINAFNDVLKNPNGTASKADLKAAAEGKKFYEDALKTATFTVARKDELFSKYINALDPTARANAYQEIESEVFSTIARQYGFSDESVKKAWATFSDGRAKAHNLIRERAYTGSPEAAELAGKANVINGPEGVAHIFPMPLNETQLVKQLPTLDIDTMYNALNKYTRASRFEKGGKVYKTTQRGREVGSELIDGLDSLIKFEVLARVGYPVRNVSEGWLRIMNTVGPMAIIKAAAPTLVSNKFVGASYKQIFKWSNTVKLNTKRAELMAERAVTDNVDAIDTQIAEIDAMLAGKMKITDKYGMGLNEVDGVKYEDALGASPEAAAAITDRFIKNASRIVDSHFGNTKNSLSRAYETNGDFVVINGSDANWVDGYIRVINRQIRGSKITQQFLEGKTVDEVVNWMRGTSEGRKVMKDLAMGRDFEAIAEANLKNIESLFPAGVADNLKDIAAQRAINADDIEKAFGTNTLTRPQINAAQISSANGTSAASSLMANTLEKFYNIAGEVPESALVRHPLFVDLYRKRIEASVRQAIDTYPGDSIPPEYLRKVENSARQWARAEMRRTLYDTSERVDAAHTLKYIFPFFGAFADVTEKWGRILINDPSVIRKLETVYDSPDRMGMVEEKDGIRYINFPGEWAKRLSWGKTDRPVAIPKPSLNLIFQGGAWWNPGAGWFVQFAASNVLKAVPDFEKNALVKEILPYGPDGTGWKDLVVQSAGARKVMALFDAEDPMRANLTVTIAMEENHRYDTGLRDTVPTAKEIDQRVKGVLALEAASRFILPFATNTRSPYQFYIDEYQRMRSEDAENATQKFWETYGEDYFIFTTSRSKNNTGIGATIEADKATKQLSDLIAKQPEYGWFIVGDANNGEFSSTVYKKQREQAVAPGSTTKMRESQDPYEAIAATNTEKGWIAYNKGMDYIESQRIQRGLKSLTSKGAEDLADAKKQFIAALEAENPDWGQARGKIDINKVNNFLGFAKEMVADPRVAERPDVKAMGDYLKGREYVRQMLAVRKSKTITSPDNADIKEIWDAFVGDLIDENITFNRVYTRMLENDDLRKGF